MFGPLVDVLASLSKSGGPYLGPKGGLWADPQHTVHWEGHHGAVEVEPHASTRMYPIHLHIEDAGNGEVKISPAKGASGPTIPRESLNHLVNDLRGIVDVPKGHAHPGIAAVTRGDARMLGKGDDGVAFKHGDVVVKVSTTVPYQPFNQGHRTPKEAADMLKSQVGVGNHLADLGLPVVRSEFIRHGDKGFQIKPYVEIPPKLSREQLDEVQAALHAMHDKGYAMNDDIQAGELDGKMMFFDVGKAAPAKGEGQQSDKSRDIDRLRMLYQQNGQRFVNSRDPVGKRMWSDAEGAIRGLRQGKGSVEGVKRSVERAADARRQDAHASLSGKELAAELEDIDMDVEWANEDIDGIKGTAKGSLAKGSHVPPEAVRSAARRGLELRKKHGKGGLTTQEAGKQGIGSGVARASNLAAGDAVSTETLRRMIAFFSRHRKNKSGGEDDAGYIAWLLWGGDPGEAWAKRELAKVDRVEKGGTLLQPMLDLVEVQQFGWLELPRSYVLALGDVLAKGLSHRYIRRVPTGKVTKTGKPRYRYYYHAAHGGTVGNEDHYVVGASFKDNEGHWHITARDGDTLTLKHDETGAETTMTKRELREHLVGLHREAIAGAQERARQDIADARASGASAKQVARLRERAARVGVDTNDDFETETDALPELRDRDQDIASRRASTREGRDFFRSAKVGTEVETPKGSGRVVGFNHAGTMMVKTAGGEVNVYTSHVDANPGAYRVSGAAQVEVKADVPTVATPDRVGKRRAPTPTEAAEARGAIRKMAPGASVKLATNGDLLIQKTPGFKGNETTAVLDYLKSNGWVFGQSGTPDSSEPRYRRTVSAGISLDAIRVQRDASDVPSAPVKSQENPGKPERAPVSVAAARVDVVPQQTSAASEPPSSEPDRAAVFKQIRDIEHEIDPYGQNTIRPVRWAPMVVRDPKRYAELRAKIHALEETIGRRPWQRTKEAMQAVDRMPAEKHREIVVRAIAEGKPVPAEVLAGHPGAAEEAAAPKQVTAAATSATQEGEQAIPKPRKFDELMRRADALDAKLSAMTPAPSAPSAPKPTTAATNFADDIPMALAVSAHSGTSHVPERRGEQEREGYAAHLSNLRGQLAKYETPENRESIEQAFAEYRAGYASRYKAMLAAKSRVMSSMVTGPARFPTASNRKKGDVADSRTNDVVEWSGEQSKKLLKRFNPNISGPISSDRKDAVSAIESEVDKLKARQSMMVAANKVYRSKSLSDDEKVAKLVELGVSPAVARAQLKPDFAGRIGFPDYALVNNAANIRRLESRAESVATEQARATTEHAFDGGRVVDDADANRVRIYHDSKPSADVIAKLKSSGFKWSPSEGAWQRQRNNAARYAAGVITGANIGKGTLSPLLDLLGGA